MDKPAILSFFSVLPHVDFLLAGKFMFLHAIKCRFLAKLFIFPEKVVDSPYVLITNIRRCQLSVHFRDKTPKFFNSSAQIYIKFQKAKFLVKFLAKFQYFSWPRGQSRTQS
jgi:hypothetical protein